MLKKIGIAVAVLLLVLIAVIATRPGEFKIERSTAIAAPPAVVFSNVNNLHKWAQWNPFEKGQNLKMEYSGTEEGVGASYHYEGEKAGEGRMTIAESVPGERVAVKGEFIKPMAAVNDIVFTFAPEGAGTKVTWAMSGKNNFVSKAFGLVMNMDTMVGGMFEKGLVDMKTVSEAQAKTEAEAKAKAEADAKAQADAQAQADGGVEQAADAK